MDLPYEYKLLIYIIYYTESCIEIITILKYNSNYFKPNIHMK